MAEKFSEESSSNGEQGELDYIRRQIVRAVMRRDQDKALFVHTRGLIKNYTRKSAETPEQFFRNHAEYFCEYLAQQMLDNVSDWGIICEEKSEHLVVHWIEKIQGGNRRLGRTATQESPFRFIRKLGGKVDETVRILRVRKCASLNQKVPIR